MPYRKDVNPPMYLNCMSDHPPNVIKDIPRIIESRLNQISKDKVVFENAIGIYQNALRQAGYTHKLRYIEKNTTSTRRKRQRHVTWYNPPWCGNVETNVAGKVLSFVDRHFPKRSELHKIINRSTSKVSYSCTENME